MTDGELLKQYAQDRSESAFEELVRRHLNLVYSAALRQVNGNPHLAEDVSQSVFADLARKARRLASHPSLAGWLYTCTRYTASTLRRTEQRRTAREQEAYAMNAILSAAAPEAEWAQLRPLLDDAMHTLDDEDREAVLLRHFENRSYAEIGAFLGLKENSARMRVERALDKLQAALARQGLTSTAIVLGGLLAANAAGVAPAHLAKKIVQAAASGVVVAGAAVFTVSKVVLVMAVVAGLMVAAWLSSGRSTTPKSPVGAVNAVPTNHPAMDVPAVAAPVVSPVRSANAPITNGVRLRLEIVAADSGKPIPNVPIDYGFRVAGRYQSGKLASDRLGICDVLYSGDATELSLITRKDYFADTKLLWQPANGDIIPTNYVLRLDRGVPIGGTVVGPDGKPVAGARVGWNHQESPVDLKLPQNHEFGWIQVMTDQDGRWQVTRIAEDMMTRLYGCAEDSNYVDAPLIFVERDKNFEKALRAGAAIFHLGRGFIARGMVVTPDGAPIGDAKVLVGERQNSSSREGRTRSDGTFVIGGCEPGDQLVTAEAPGYAATTVQANLADDTEPIRLTLQLGQLLRLRIVNQAGEPIRGAYIWNNTIPQGATGHKPVQIDFNPRSDREGRAVLTNAPGVELTFDVQARGYLRIDGIKVHPDGQEHVVTLSTALVVHGFVHDALTGEPIPHFRVVEGWPEVNAMNGTTNAQWSDIGRFWLAFGNGVYTNSFEEEVTRGNPGFILKFIADGYSPFISRVIREDEGDVRLNVSLDRAATTVVTVYDPDGRPAANADVGLVSPGVRLKLVPGGFSREDSRNTGALLRTGPDGTFRLSPDDSVVRVIITSAGGYGEFAPAGLSANPVVHLQPWGRLEITCLSGGKPVVGREYLLDLPGSSPDAVSFDFNASRFETDGQGQFTVPMVPPGRLALIRLYPQPMDNGMKSWAHGNKTFFDVQAGQTARLVFGTNHVVTARLQWPDGVQRDPQWSKGGVLHSLLPAMSPEIAADKAARQAFRESDDYKAAKADYQSWPAIPKDDDTVSVEDIPPGNYVFRVVYYTAPGGTGPIGPSRPLHYLFHGTLDVTVPEGTGTFDAGFIQLQPGSPPPE